jgi:hypothetical protein
MEGVMPFETIAYLTFVVSAFTLFAVTLTYAEWATRHADDTVPETKQFKQEKSPHRNDPDVPLKAA